LLVVLWVGLNNGFAVPTRLFADAATRTAFIAAVRERAAAARSEKSEAEVPKS